MIERVVLKNFKCFDNISLKCAPLSLLCGVNGSGKSSAIQALLVLRQSVDSGDLRRGMLVLGGDLTDIGTGQDVLYEDASDDIVAFELHHCRVDPCRFTFLYEREADRLTARADGLDGLDTWHDVPPLGGTLVYVSAERIGPRKVYSQSETLARSGHLGARGEYSVNYLAARQHEHLSRDDPRSGGRPERVLNVVDYWLQEVTPGAHLQLETVDAADAIIAGFSFDRTDHLMTRRYRATNVGFGLSYTLPVIMGLLSTPGSLCLIENPEAHLHPRGQTRLAELAVRASLAGVQVIVETHSDHFIDGVRIAVRDGIINPDGVVFHYFFREHDRAATSSPEIDADGRLSSWPAGFFDQHEENLAKLLAPRL